MHCANIRLEGHKRLAETPVQYRRVNPGLSNDCVRLNSQDRHSEVWRPRREGGEVLTSSVLGGGASGR
jgi:hypothetical protein